MLEYEVTGSKTINCPKHRNEPASHICIEHKCQNTPILCKICFIEQINRHYHFDHDKSLVSFEEGIDVLCADIKSHTGGVNNLVKGVLGKPEFTQILQQMENGQVVFTELEDKINSIKGKVEIELELLAKDFQKTLMIEKQEYFKLLDNFKKTYQKNLEQLKSETEPILDFNNSYKNFNNRNTFYLKVAREVRKKSNWIVKVKKNLQTTIKNLESSRYSTNLSQMLSSANQNKVESWPTWKGESFDKPNELKTFAKKILNEWVSVPEIKAVEKETEIDQSPRRFSLSPTKLYYLNGK